MDDRPDKPNVFSGRDEGDTDFLTYWRIVRKGKHLVILVVIIAVFSIAILSLFMSNIYKATAVITPAATKEKEGTVTSLMTQFGITPPGSSSGPEIVSLLNSNILREKVIQNYNLLPLLFHERWDEERKVWKEEKFPWLRKFIRSITSENTKGGKRKESPGPEIWDGLREFKEIVSVKNNLKENMITISVEFWNPEIAAKMVDNLLTALNDHMTSEAKRVAKVNMKYLEEQVDKNPDPFIKQKIYALIAQQIETSMMAEVKENFAFKVIDPPKAPDRKVKPQRALMIILSFVVSLFIGILAVFSREYFKRIKASS